VADYVCQVSGFGYGINLYPEKEKFKFALKSLNIQQYSLDLITESLKEEMAKMEKEGLV